MNPNGTARHLVYFVDALVQWNRPSPELNDVFAKVLAMFKQGMGDQWDPVVASFPMNVKQRLKEKYGL